MDELLAALERHHNTSPGPDGIYNCILTHLPSTGKEFLLSMYNHIWVPSAWREAVIVLILKPSKDRTLAINYRPISLISCVCKAMECMVTVISSGSWRVKAFFQMHSALFITTDPPLTTWWSWNTEIPHEVVHHRPCSQYRNLSCHWCLPNQPSLHAECGEPPLSLQRNLLLCGYAVKLAALPHYPSHGAVFHPTLCSRYKLNITASWPVDVCFCQLLQRLNIRLPHMIPHRLLQIPPWHIVHLTSQAPKSHIILRLVLLVFQQTTFCLPRPHGGVYQQVIYSCIDRQQLQKWWPGIFLSAEC
jgi:hypothetical protein